MKAWVLFLTVSLFAYAESPQPPRSSKVHDLGIRINEKTHYDVKGLKYLEIGIIACEKDYAGLDWSSQEVVAQVQALYDALSTFSEDSVYVKFTDICIGVTDPKTPPSTKNHTSRRSGIGMISLPGELYSTEILVLRLSPAGTIVGKEEIIAYLKKNRLARGTPAKPERIFPRFTP